MGWDFFRDNKIRKPSQEQGATMYAHDGLVVSGAGDPECNGFYRRREGTEQPSCYDGYAVYLSIGCEILKTPERKYSWNYHNGGRTWYSKDDGRYDCYISLAENGHWYLNKGYPINCCMLLCYY